MFKVTRWTSNGNFSITDENKNYLHADGRAYYKCGEYWPTRELAQAVLDKYQPPHVWKHGDVFKNNTDTWIYLEPHNVPRVLGLNYPEGDDDIGSTPSIQLQNATFLFNIREKL